MSARFILLFSQTYQNPNTSSSNAFLFLPDPATNFIDYLFQIFSQVLLERGMPCFVEIDSSEKRHDQKVIAMERYCTSVTSKSYVDTSPAASQGYQITHECRRYQQVAIKGALNRKCTKHEFEAFCLKRSIASPTGLDKYSSSFRNFLFKGIQKYEKLNADDKIRKYYEFRCYFQLYNYLASEITTELSWYHHRIKVLVAELEHTGLKNKPYSWWFRRAATQPCRCMDRMSDDNMESLLWDLTNEQIRQQNDKEKGKKYLSETEKLRIIRTSNSYQLTKIILKKKSTVEPEYH